MKYIFFMLILFTCVHTFSQDSLYQARNKLWAAYPQEQLYLQTSKDIYESGEDLWFKVYHLDAYSFGRSIVSQTLYLEMLNNQDSIVWQEKYPVRQGITLGHVYVDEKLADGDYYLRACTRNSCYDDTLHSVFSRKILVVKHISGMKSLADSVVFTDSVRFGLYPEGGYLIHGLPCRLAFKGTNGCGQPVFVEGSLYKNDTLLTAFSSSHDGMGSIMFVPDMKGKYHIRLNNGKEYSLPEIQEHGVTLQLIRQTEEMAEFYILKSAGLPAQKIYLTGQLRGVVCCMAQGIVTDRLKISVPLKEFPYQGIAEFTLYNADLQPLAERLVYVHPEKKLYITATLDKDIYKLRDKAAIKITVRDEADKPVPNVNLGVTIFDSEYADPTRFVTMLSYNYLTSQLRGGVYNASYYFDESNVDRLRALDFLLLTQGWRRYVWNSYDASAYKGKPFLEEGISGKQIIPRKRKRSKIEGIPQLVKVFTSDERIQYLVIDSIGNFNITSDILSDMSGNYLYLKPMLQEGYNPKLIINDSFVELDSLCKLKPVSFLGSLLFKDIHIEKNIYQNMDRSVLLNEVTISKKSKVRIFRDKFMGKLDSLTSLKFNAEWVCECAPLYLNDYLPGYSHHTSFFNPYHGQKIVPIKGKKYRVIKYVLGENGVFIEDVKNIVYSGATYSEEELLRINGLWRIKGYYGAREFYQPDESCINISTPDVRNTLLWSPSITTDSKGEAIVNFYCSDINTKFIYRIEGMNNAGLLGNIQSEFRVYKKDVTHVTE